ncbi:MAG: 1-deoxy-D-xylulose-5-phosphate synthase [Bacteroidia bacterium]|nr:1-deoxy-D-xylulose-5-phosphate synthase [Bacteroidia bacterium]
MKDTRIMWIESKDGLAGPARIGRVTFSKSRKSINYQGKTFHTLAGQGFKANYADVETGEEYWISGCHKDGRDALYSTDVEIDEDVREEYWTKIRKDPEKVHVKQFRAMGKCN